MNRYLIICRLRWPAFLLLTGIIFLLDETDVLSWSHAWPLYLILWGILALAERAAFAAQPPVPMAAYPGSYPGTYPGQYPGPYAAGTYAGQYPGPSAPAEPVLQPVAQTVVPASSSALVSDHESLSVPSHTHTIEEEEGR